MVWWKEGIISGSEAVHIKKGPIMPRVVVVDCIGKNQLSFLGALRVFMKTSSLKKI